MIFTTYEIRNFREGHLPPTHLSTSIASFPLIMFRGYKPATFLAEELFSKFEYFGVKEVILRGGVSANLDYIPTRYGGNCKTYIAGCKEKRGEDFYEAVTIYYDWLMTFTRNHSAIIKAVEVVNECFWKSDLRLWDKVPCGRDFYCPTFCSEPADIFTPAKLKKLKEKELYPCYQIHKTWSNQLPEPPPTNFSIGEDYCYNKEDERAFYHCHA